MPLMLEKREGGGSLESEGCFGIRGGAAVSVIVPILID